MGLWYSDRILEINGWEAEKKLFSSIIHRMVWFHSFVTLSTTVRQFIKFVLGVKLLARSLIEASNPFQILERVFYSQSLRFLMRQSRGLKTYLGSTTYINLSQVERNKKRFRTETIWNFYNIAQLTWRKWNIFPVSGFGFNSTIWFRV